MIGDGLRRRAQHRGDRRPRWPLPAASLALTLLAASLVARTATGPAGCDRSAAPQPLQVAASQLAATLRTTGLGTLASGARVDEEGTQVASAAWSDNPRLGALGAAATTSAGYEVRWWSASNAHQVADLFEFPSAADASQWVRIAAESSCRTNASSVSVSAPPGARVVVWTNPLGLIQADLLFARGARAYRIGGVPAHTSAPSAVLAVVTADELSACRLADAGCVTLPPPSELVA